MYDELVKRLRASCESCKLWDGYKCCLKGECSAHTRLEAADAIEDLIAALTASNEVIAKNKPRWIPVTERLPEVNKYVLGYFKDNSMTAVCLFDIDEHMTFWRACTDEGWEADCDSEPTHWMPLPEPPKEE